MGLILLKYIALFTHTELIHAAEEVPTGSLYLFNRSLRDKEQNSTLTAAAIGDKRDEITRFQAGVFVSSSCANQLWLNNRHLQRDCGEDVLHPAFAFKCTSFSLLHFSSLCQSVKHLTWMTDHEGCFGSRSIVSHEFTERSSF